ncbi:MAG: ferritin-like domain-containing protein [Planctomycetota bacterium]|nr:ferritin-like domain-containing protein [Planctomycetota bacterium]
MTAPNDSPLVHASLLADMRTALLAEFGARSMYAHLAVRIRDPELAQVIARFHEDEIQIVERLRQVLTALGMPRIPRKSRRRALLSWCLAFTSRGRASSMALRACIDSENVIARWYAEYARYLAAAGRTVEARTCDELAGMKLRHARILEAWVPH